MLAGGKPVTFMQDDLALRITGLPSTPPDEPATVIALECDADPIMDRDYVRERRPRYKVGMS